MRPLLRSSLCLVPFLLSACGEEAPPPPPAPPTDRNFTATVDDQPVVGGTQTYECVIQRLGATDAQFLLTFTDDIGHTIQIGIARGDDAPGAREVTSGMATMGGVAFGRPTETAAEITRVLPHDDGIAISGRFSARYDVVNVAPGLGRKEPLLIRDAIFEQVPCLDMTKPFRPKR